MPGGHHPRSPVEHRTEVVTLPQLCFAGRDPHPDRQIQFPLRGHCSIHRRSRRRECGADTVTGVLEHEAAVRLDGGAQHLVMRGEGFSHAIGVGLPPTGGTLNIGEQKRHHPRWGSRRHDIASAHAICPSKPSDLAIAR